jgi:hypothetical protein
MKLSPRTLWLPLSIAVAALVWRIAKLKFGAVDFIPNFAPWMALSFAGGALMQRSIPGWIWAVALILCDTLCIGISAFQDMGSVFVCYLAAGVAATFLQKQRSIMTVLGGTVACSALFYLVTNTQAWWMSAAYSKTAAGWLQALTVGDPRYQPQTWVFGVNSLVSDLAFAVLLVVAYNSEALLRKVQGLTLSPQPQAA